MPVVINSGSGNQGMTVSLPVIEFAKSLFCTEEQLYRALVVSNLVAIHQKKYIAACPHTAALSVQHAEAVPPSLIFTAAVMRTFPQRL